MQNNPKQKPKATKAQKGCLIFVIVIGIAFIVFLIASKIGSPEAVTKAEWDGMSYENKTEWIESFLKDGNDNTSNYEVQIASAINHYFKYPEEVEYTAGSYPFFSHGRIVDANTGTVFLNGTGTAKNGFGVKSRFMYSVRLIVLPDTLYVDTITVNNSN